MAAYDTVWCKVHEWETVYDGVVSFRSVWFNTAVTDNVIELEAQKDVDGLKALLADQKVLSGLVLRMSDKNNHVLGKDLQPGVTKA